MYLFKFNNTRLNLSLSHKKRYGDGSGNTANVRLYDSVGQTFQYTYGAVSYIQFYYFFMMITIIAIIKYKYVFNKNEKGELGRMAIQNSAISEPRVLGRAS